jgi:hypothetical protein
MLGQFPEVTDKYLSPPQQVPMLIAAFHGEYLLRELLPLAAKGIEQQGEAEGRPEEGVQLASHLPQGRRVSQLQNMEVQRVGNAAIALYTQDTWLYKQSNCVLRGVASPEVGERLWPFISILQMAVISRDKDNGGGLIYRGAVIDRTDIEDSGGKLVLRGFTSCSRREECALNFVSHSASSVPVASCRPGVERQARRGVGVPVMFEIKLPYVHAQEAQVQAVGAGVSLRHLAGAFEAEEEVVLLDGTMLQITEVKHDSTTPFDPARLPPYPLPCLQIRAEVDWGWTVEYFKILQDEKLPDAPFVSGPSMSGGAS